MSDSHDSRLSRPSAARDYAEAAALALALGAIGLVILTGLARALISLGVAMRELLT